MKTTKVKRPRKTRPSASKGEGSRTTILQAAARLATTKGLNGLSIGDLADEVGMSKSGLYAHFKSKEELELATIETAAGIFEREVLQPAAAGGGGASRIRALTKTFLSHLERRVFPGGCFFAALTAELDTRPGPARDRVLEILNGWLGGLQEAFEAGQASGELDPSKDAEQAAFEIESMLMTGNFLFVMTSDKTYLRRTETGVEDYLRRFTKTA